MNFLLPNAIVKAAAVLDAPLPVKVAVGAKQFDGKLALSSDGRFAAYVLQNGKQITEPSGGTTHLYTKSGVPVFRQGCNVWLTDLRNGRTVNLTKGFGSSWYPVWSGDSRYLAFLSDHGGAVHIWIWDRVAGWRRQVSSAIVHDASDAGAIHWVDGDRKLLATLILNGTTVADADTYPMGYVTKRNGRTELSHATVRVYSNDAQAPNNAGKLARLQGYDGSSNGDPCDYALVDVTHGDVTTIFPNTTVDEIAISDDQRYAVMKRVSGAAVDARDQALYDLVVVSLADGKKLFTLHDLPMAYGWPPTWRPRLDAFVYTTGARLASMATKQHGEIGQSFLVSVPNGQTRKITGGIHPEFGLYNQSTGWSADGKHLYYVVENRIWVADVDTGIVKPFAAELPLSIRAFVTVHDDRIFQRGDALYVLARSPETKQEGFAAIDSVSGKISTQLLGDQHIGGPIDTLIAASAAANSIIYVREDATHPWDLWLADPTFTYVHQLTHLNPELERYRYGQTHLITWSTPDGQSYHGALLLPSNYVQGRRYPTIIYQYPLGEKSNNLNKFGGEGAIWGNFQLYATRGYAVVMPDMVWESFQEADLTNGRSLDWLNAMLDRLIASGVSDSSRFGLEGLSHGGYSTLAFITQTNRLRAAIDDSGYASEFSPYAELSRNDNAFYVNQQERTIGGTPWMSLDKYIAMSPFFKFDRVTTPVMIVQGSGSTWIQQKEGDETYVALRRLNKEVTYVLYEGDGHTRQSLIYPHEIDYWNRAIDWYDRHLKIR